MGFRPERNMLFNAAAPDRDWLNFTQYVTQRALGARQRLVGEEFSRPRVFDGRTASDWGFTFDRADETLHAQFSDSLCRSTDPSVGRRRRHFRRHYYSRLTHARTGGRWWRRSELLGRRYSDCAN